MRLVDIYIIYDEARGSQAHDVIPVVSKALNQQNDHQRRLALLVTEDVLII